MRGGCGPEAPCGRSLVAMERAHRQAMEELQKQHDRQLKELEAEQERRLQEETRDTARGQHTGLGGAAKECHDHILNCGSSFKGLVR